MTELTLDYSKYNFRDNIKYSHVTSPGLSEEIVEEISRIKNEPEWMRRFRLDAYRIFRAKPLPSWGADITRLDFDKIRYYMSPTDKKSKSWDEVPENIKKTFDRLGIPGQREDPWQESAHSTTQK